MYVCLCYALHGYMCVWVERERKWGWGGHVCIYLVESCHSTAHLPDTGRKWIPFLLSLLCSLQLHVFVFDYVCVHKNDLSSYKGKENMIYIFSALCIQYCLTDCSTQRWFIFVWFSETILVVTITLKRAAMQGTWQQHWQPANALNWHVRTEDT